MLQSRGFTYDDKAIENNEAFAKSGAVLKVATEVYEEMEVAYQWYKNDEQIAGATSDSYAVNEYAVYHCVTSNVVASQNYKEEAVSDKVKIVKNKISFQEAIDRAESKSASGLTFNNTSISFDEEQIDLGDGFGEYTFVTGDAVVNKSLVISSSAGTKLFNNSKLSINADDVALSGLEIDTIEATAELGNGRLTIRDSKLNNLLLNGGGYNSIYMDGKNTVTNASFGKKDFNQYVCLKGLENGSTEITNLNFLTSGMIQGNLNISNVITENWGETLINFAMDVQANVTVSADVTEVYFGTMEGTTYEPKFKILLNNDVKLNGRFLNQAGNKLWGDDFYGYSWFDVDNNKYFDFPILTESKIGDLLTGEKKVLRLSCDAKEKAIFLPHIIPTEQYIYKDGDFISATKQFHLTHYSKLYESLKNHDDTIDIEDSNEVEMETLLLANTDDYSHPDLKGYENAFSVVHDDNRNVYATIACGSVANDKDLRRYGHFYIKMLRETDISEKLNSNDSGMIEMEKRFKLPDYFSDLSYLGDSISDYAGVNSEVSYFNDIGDFHYNNNFVASFARLAVDGEGAKLYLLTGADGADATGDTYKLCVYDLIDTSEQLTPVEIDINWKSGVPQAMALSEDGKSLYVAEIKYNDYQVNVAGSCINVYVLNGTSASYSTKLFSYESLPETFSLGNENVNKANKYFFGKTRIGVSDMKAGNGCLYITTENVNKHVSVCPTLKYYSRGALTIVDLKKSEIIEGKGQIGYSSTEIPTDEYEYFYGPTRILAVEPRKIIILDDGNDDDDEFWDFTLVPSASGIWSETFLKQKNRVAVYDLEKEALNFANMGSDFGLYSTRINGSF